MRPKLLVPLAVFVVICGFLLLGLWRDPREVPSPLIDKPAPAFQLARLDDPTHTVRLEDLRGQVWLLNVWASWCVSCREEHPLLVALGKANIVPIVGLDYKDETTAGKRWLADNGNPYTTSVVDRDGKVGIDWGVYGVPETFVIDKAGTIRYKQIGPLTAEALEKKIVPLIRELQKS
jgi:cytochrome c biogenesis protein CcmG/thiol:disulfide interchange protein DsbE